MYIYGHNSYSVSINLKSQRPWAIVTTHATMRRKLEKSYVPYPLKPDEVMRTLLGDTMAVSLDELFHMELYYNCSWFYRFNMHVMRYTEIFTKIKFYLNSKGITTSVWCNISFASDLYVNCAAPPLSAYDIFMSLRYTRGNRWNWWLFCNFIPFYCTYNVLVRGIKYGAYSGAYGVYKTQIRYNNNVE